MEAQQLVTLLRSGDTTPLRFLFEQYGPYCQRLLRQRTGCSRDEAHDTFTEALLVFRRNVMEGKVTEVKHPKTYLYTICYYLYRAQRRQQQRQAAQHPEVGRMWYDDYQESPEHERLEQEMVRQRLSQRISQALEQLTPRCRELLRYFYVEGKNIPEVTQRLGSSSPNAVKTARHRCFRQWVEKIEEMND